MLVSSNRRLAIGVVLCFYMFGSFIDARASIPDADGTYHGCLKSNGTVDLIDPSTGATCKSNESAVTWSQTGPQGPSGPAGPAGATGATGPVGPMGAQGLQGPAGPTGAMGAQGLQGPAGPTGAMGAQGPQGPAGAGGQDTFFSGYFDFGAGSAMDNQIRLSNPTGCPNSVPTSYCASPTQPVCAMIYILDTNQAMGECCGCLIGPQQMLHSSLKSMIGSSWASGSGAPSTGMIQIVSATPNNGSACSASQPYTQTPTLDGWITHAQTFSGISSLTEVSLTDNGNADVNTQTYLSGQCAAIVGNGSGTAVCTCPTP